MARIRTVKPEFWEDEIIGTLSREARLLFIATFNMADDEGLLRWSPAYIKSQAFMYDDDITVSLTEQFMAELTEAGLLFSYIGGRARQQLAFIVNFRRHQKINRPQPSKLAAPSLQNAEVRYMYGRRDGWTCHLCNESINETPQNDDRFNLSIDHLKPQSDGGADHPSNVKASHQSCNKRRRNKPLTSKNESRTDDSLNDSVNGSPPEGEGEREREGNNQPPSEVGAPRKRATRIPDNFIATVITPQLVQWTRDNTPDIDARFHTDQFVDYWTGKSGKDATKVDWVATWRKWMRSEQQKTTERRPRQDAPGSHMPARGGSTGSKRVDKAIKFLHQAAEFERQEQATLTLPSFQPQIIEGGRSA